MEETRVIYLLRGVAGAGKSTLAKTLEKALNGFNLEADQFHYDEKGYYNWKAENLPAAHRGVRQWVEYHMVRGNGPVIVSDTNVKQKDLNVYLDLANKYGYRIVSLVVENRHGNDSVHDVAQSRRESQVQALRHSLKLI